LRVRSVDAVASERGDNPPDAWAGAKSSRDVLDYGEPSILLSDSSKESYRIRAELEIWAKVLERKVPSDQQRAESK
jgi:hypothetical protein